MVKLSFKKQRSGGQKCVFDKNSKALASKLISLAVCD